MGEGAEVSSDELTAFPLGETEMWVQNAVLAEVRERLPFEVGETLRPGADTRRVIVVGGGTLLDGVKGWWADHRPDLELIAVPSIWGSGAEVSPIVVRTVDGRKSVRVGEEFVPTRVAYLPELSSLVPPDRAISACGDCWSHALEGFLSPLASVELRKEIARLIAEMLAVEPGNSPEWFRLSSRACRAQSQSSVGLVHGFAHVLEGPLSKARTDEYWGHAALCSLFLRPVLDFDCEEGQKALKLFEDYSIDLDRVLRVASELHDPSAYETVVPFLEEHWNAILRDQCSRTNVRLVRRSHIDFFRDWRKH